MISFVVIGNFYFYIVVGSHEAVKNQMEGWEDDAFGEEPCLPG